MLKRFLMFSVMAVVSVSLTSAAVPGIIIADSGPIDDGRGLALVDTNGNGQGDIAVAY